MRIYCNYTDHELNEWQTMPMVASVLTSSAFKAWLLRRDENKAKQEYSFEGMTNGEVMKVVFPKAKVDRYIDEYERSSDYLMYIDDETYFTKEWWNAPYKGGVE